MFAEGEIDSMDLGNITQYVAIASEAEVYVWLL